MSGERQWSGKTHGTLWMHKGLIALFKVLPLPVMYLLMSLVIPFYMLFNHKGYISIYHYLRRRQGWGPVKAFLGCYGNHFLFGTAILDRFAAYAGRRFKTESQDHHLFHDLSGCPEGFLMFSSHIGNGELCGYMLHSTKRMNAISFGGEKENIRQSREKMFGGNNIRLIPTDNEMDWLFTLNAALSDGEIVSIHADRSFGSPRTVTVPFLGADADLPLGPFSIAAMRDLPVLAIYTLKTGLKRYQVFFFRLDTPELKEMSREKKIKTLAESYARVTENILREYPLQWYNFFEFWKI